MSKPPPPPQSAIELKETKRYKDFAKLFGFQVRRVRESLGLTLEAASGKTGLAWRHLQRLETGGSNVTLATILRLADAFGVSPSVFFVFDRTTSASTPPADPEPPPSSPKTTP